ncbi:MAG: hypothetical protein AVDCRST_MAG69-1026, partial [uncultured Solirubrobacteraceae bacterium]
GPARRHADPAGGLPRRRGLPVDSLLDHGRLGCLRRRPRLHHGGGRSEQHGGGVPHQRDGHLHPL